MSINPIIRYKFIYIEHIKHISIKIMKSLYFSGFQMCSNSVFNWLSVFNSTGRYKRL